jgi:hypothetical protein
MSNLRRFEGRSLLWLQILFAIIQSKSLLGHAHS